MIRSELGFEKGLSPMNLGSFGSRTTTSWSPNQAMISPITLLNPGSGIGEMNGKDRRAIKRYAPPSPFCFNRSLSLRHPLAGSETNRIFSDFESEPVVSVGSSLEVFGASALIMPFPCR